MREKNSSNKIELKEIESSRKPKWSKSVSLRNVRLNTKNIKEGFSKKERIEKGNSKLNNSREIRDLKSTELNNKERRRKRLSKENLQSLSTSKEQNKSA